MKRKKQVREFTDREREKILQLCEELKCDCNVFTGVKVAIFGIGLGKMLRKRIKRCRQIERLLGTRYGVPELVTEVFKEVLSDTEALLESIENIESAIFMLPEGRV